MEGWGVSLETRVFDSREGSEGCVRGGEEWAALSVGGRVTLGKGDSWVGGWNRGRGRGCWRGVEGDGGGVEVEMERMMGAPQLPSPSGRDGSLGGERQRGPRIS